MPEAGQKFLQMLVDGKIHECEWVKPYVIHMGDGTVVLTGKWVAKVNDDIRGFAKDQHFLMTPTSF